MKGELDKDVVNRFIINTVLINPIADIVSKLENKEFRDCDINWLDNKFEKYIFFAAETLGIKIDAFAEPEKYVRINEFVNQYYIERFNNLLNYFKSF